MRDNYQPNATPHQQRTKQPTHADKTRQKSTAKKSTSIPPMMQSTLFRKSEEVSEG